MNGIYDDKDEDYDVKTTMTTVRTTTTMMMTTMTMIDPLAWVQGSMDKNASIDTKESILGVQYVAVTVTVTQSPGISKS